MDDAFDFERAVQASPNDDSLRRAFANWLDARTDSRGEFIRAWFSLREAAHNFQMALNYWADTDRPRDVKYADDFYDFYEAVYNYRQLALVVDRDWLWRLGSIRPWVDLSLGRLIATYVIWDYGFDWQADATEESIKPERAWLFRYDEPDAPSRQEGRDCPSWYLVHKFLGIFKDVDTCDPLLLMQELEGQW